VQVTAKVTSKGQITIPKEIRRVLRIAEGDTVIFEADEQGVRLHASRPTSIFAEYAGIWREGAGKTLDEINAELHELRGHIE
jgi:AbrB family looped-hinge helix DNA binding protein